RLEYVGMRVVAAVLAALPLRVGMALGAAVAAAVIRIAGRVRRGGLAHLAIAVPGEAEPAPVAMPLASYRNLGSMVAECAHLHRLDAANVRATVTPDDGPIWTNEMLPALASQGILVLTGHFGNWEMFAYVYGLLGHPVSLVHQTIKNP